MCREAEDYVRRSAPEVVWTTRTRTDPGVDVSHALPKTLLLSFETGDDLGADAEKELFERLEVEIVRTLFRDRAKLLARRQSAPRETVREFSWEYDAFGRRGLVSAWGVRHADAYEVTITIHEMGDIR